MTLRRTVTLSSVATACNVKPATVSRVLNNVSKGFSVSADKRELIMRKAAELGYMPNQAARSLRLSRTGRIMVYGLSIGWGLNERTYSRMLKSCVSRLNQEGFEVDVAYPASNSQISSHLAYDGAVIVNPGFEGLLEEVRKIKAPYVVMNDRPDLQGCSYVSVDDVEGMRMALEYLRGKGHRRIAYRCTNNGREVEEAHRSIFERYHTYVEEMTNAGEEAFSDYDQSYDMVEFLAELRKRGISAVVTYNCSNALGLAGQCAVEGVRIPGDLSVVSFNRPLYPMIPELTAIELPLEEMGTATAEILIEAINEGKSCSRQLMFRENLYEGQSVADIRK